MRKKLLSIILALAMLACMIPMSAVSVSAAATLYTLFGGYFYPATNDTSPSTDNVQNYSVYIIEYGGDGASALAYVMGKGEDVINNEKISEMPHSIVWSANDNVYGPPIGSGDSKTVSISGNAYAVVYYHENGIATQVCVKGANPQYVPSSLIIFDAYGYDSGWQTLAAPASHTHTKGTEYMTDGRAHWLKCDDEDCPLIGKDDAETILNYELAFSSYEGPELKKALDYSETCHTNGADTTSMLMGRQGRIIDKSTGAISNTDGRTIIGLTAEQLGKIGNKLVIVGSDDSDNNKQISVDVDCAYTWFYDGGEKIEAANVTDLNGNPLAAFVILDNDGKDGTITGFGYYRVYSDTVSDSTLIGEALYKSPRTFKAVYDTTGGANILNFYYDTKDHNGEGTLRDNLTNTATRADSWGYSTDVVISPVKGVNIDKTVIKNKGLKSTAYMFNSMKNIESFSGAEYLDVSNVTNMTSMFNSFAAGTSSAPSQFDVLPNVSRWNTANVTDMSEMFYNYGHYNTALTKAPDVSNWNVGNVTNMYAMFRSYAAGKSSGMNSALTETPDVSKWNTEKVTDVSYMFGSYGQYCTVAAFTFKLDLSKWNLSNASTVDSMFLNAGSKLDSSNWKVTIPKKTGESLTNETGKWYTTDSSKYITPASNKSFTLAN